MTALELRNKIVDEIGKVKGWDRRLTRSELRDINFSFRAIIRQAIDDTCDHTLRDKRGFCFQCDRYVEAEKANQS